MNFRWCIILNILLPLLLSACGSRDEAGAPQVLDAPQSVQSTSDPLQQWLDISKGELSTMNIPLALQCVQQLATQGTDFIEPIFKVLDSAESSPSAKILAVISLTGHIQPSHLERLLALTQTERDQVTRGCALNLLGLINDPAAEERIRALLTDPDPHVSKEAVLVLLRRNDDTAVQRACALWKDPATESKDRDEIVLAFPTSRALDNLFIYEDAACNASLDYTARHHAVNILGMLGTADTVSKLAACIEKEEMPHMRSLMEAAQKAILAREQSNTP